MWTIFCLVKSRLYTSRINSEPNSVPNEYILTLSQTSPGFYSVCIMNLMKTLWGKGELFGAQVLLFSQCFNIFGELYDILIEFNILGCKICQFGRLKCIRRFVKILGMFTVKKSANGRLNMPQTMRFDFQMAENIVLVGKILVTWFPFSTMFF